jgi:hypothetical protein
MDMKNFAELLQVALPVLMEIPKPRRLDDELIETCEDYGDAIRLCLDKRIRRIREGEIAEYLGFAAPHLTKVKNGQGYLTTDQELVLQHLCSNWAITQYADMRKSELAGLLDSPAAEIARLKAHVALLERRAAA